MIKRWIITGDTHGQIINRINQIEAEPNDAIIILGDVGFNFYLNKTDYKNKKNVNSLGIYIYCVRGNHEERPNNVGASVIYDDNVSGEIFIEDEFPFIRYFIDGNVYNINGYSTLVLGGAYSVDKYHRLSFFKKDSSWTGWFPDEQLSLEERTDILNRIRGKSFDLVLTHTCPVEWMPTDLFINGLNQDLIDRSTELWLQDVKENINFKIWLFGHFHDNRLIRPGVEMYYTDSEQLDTIFRRWENYNKDNCSLVWYLPKDPNFFMD